MRLATIDSRTNDAVTGVRNFAGDVPEAEGRIDTQSRYARPDYRDRGNHLRPAR